MGKVQYQTLQETHHAELARYAWVEDITWCPGMHSFVPTARVAGMHRGEGKKHHAPIAAASVRSGKLTHIDKIQNITYY